MEARNVDFVRDLFLHRGKTHAEISKILKQMYPGEKGFSERTVRRFCLNNNIVRNRITTDELEGHVRAAVKQVGPNWGRKMIKGFLKSKGIDAEDRRVGKALSVVSPLYHAARCAN